MKEYKYKINGNLYKVAVGDIDNNVAQVEVNGTPYTVELEKKEVVNVVNKPRPSAAPRTETGAKVIAKPTAYTKCESTFFNVNILFYCLPKRKIKRIF